MTVELNETMKLLVNLAKEFAIDEQTFLSFVFGWVPLCGAVQDLM